ncbi:MAG TPA: RluA family pseudouridine synthase [Candidatus Limiplasma sp.]|nr:RluA family pseudouridine synthase [Candidatus Limiplasma sp.]
MQELSLIVTPADDGLPVRRLALERLHMSYGQFKRAKFEGVLLLDGEPVHADRRAQAGQRLMIRLPQRQGGPCEPSKIQLSIAYEDEDLIVVEKPAPLPSIASRKRDGETLENAVYTYFNYPEGFLYQPVNRLDKGTSGLMVIAKHSHAQQFLQAELHTDAFVREYLAVCDGYPPAKEGWIELPIAKEDAATVRRVVSASGKPARTHYQLLDTGAGRSLLRLRLDTGRTHQIRVHLSALGCPVTGDFLYGHEHMALQNRFALHSCYLKCETLRHGIIELNSPLPKALSMLL